MDTASPRLHLEETRGINMSISIPTPSSIFLGFLIGQTQLKTKGIEPLVIVSTCQVVRQRTRQKRAENGARVKPEIHLA